jgi:hypothetical protein
MPFVPIRQRARLTEFAEWTMRFSCSRAMPRAQLSSTQGWLTVLRRWGVLRTFRASTDLKLMKVIVDQPGAPALFVTASRHGRQPNFARSCAFAGICCE